MLLRKIIERDYKVDNGPRHLGGVKFRLTWDGMTYKMSNMDAADTVSWVDLGYKRK